MSIKQLADQYKKSGRPVMVKRGKHVGYGSKLANSEKNGRRFSKLAKKAGK